MPARGLHSCVFVLLDSKLLFENRTHESNFTENEDTAIFYSQNCVAKICFLNKEKLIGIKTPNNYHYRK